MITIVPRRADNVASYNLQAGLSKTKLTEEGLEDFIDALADDVHTGPVGDADPPEKACAPVAGSVYSFETPPKESDRSGKTRGTVGGWNKRAHWTQATGRGVVRRYASGSIVRTLSGRTIAQKTGPIGLRRIGCG